MTVSSPVSLLVLCPRGAADVLAAELRELGFEPGALGSDWVRIESLGAHATSGVGQLLDERTIIVRSQIATRILRLVGEAADIDSLASLASSIRPQGSFCVRADGPDRVEIQESIGGVIHTASQAKVNLSNPDALYFVHDVDGTFFIGEQRTAPLSPDLELGKRHYKIITGAQSLSGPVAAAALRISGWDAKEDLVVWPCATGELAIEAAFRVSGKSPRAYELKEMGEHEAKTAIVAADPKLSMVASAQKNAKIAGIHKYISFSRQDLDWLDTKHDERGVDFMVGQLPNLKLYPKFVRELFYQLDFILAKGGAAAFVCINEDSAAAIEAYLPSAERSYVVQRSYIWSGQAALTVVILRTQDARKKQKKGKSAQTEGAPTDTLPGAS